MHLFGCEAVGVSLQLSELLHKGKAEPGDKKATTTTTPTTTTTTNTTTTTTTTHLLSILLPPSEIIAVPLHHRGVDLQFHLSLLKILGVQGFFAQTIRGSRLLCTLRSTCSISFRSIRIESISLRSCRACSSNSLGEGGGREGGGGKGKE
jgi:hypothetical protein